MKYSMSMALLAVASTEVSATFFGGHGFRNAQPFGCPKNIDNHCLPKHQPGLGYGGLTPGKELNPGDEHDGFKYGGGKWKCGANKVARDIMGRTFGGEHFLETECGEGVIPSIELGSKDAPDAFSMTHFNIDLEAAGIMELEFEMAHGGRCKCPPKPCQAGRNTLTNDQCGGAKKVHFKYKPHKGGKCKGKFHHIDFDCDNHCKGGQCPPKGPGGECDPTKDKNCPPKGPGGECDPTKDKNCPPKGPEGECDPTKDKNCPPKGPEGECDPTKDENCPPKGPDGECDPTKDENCPPKGPDGECDPTKDENCPPKGPEGECDPTKDENCPPKGPDGECDPTKDENCPPKDDEPSVTPPSPGSPSETPSKPDEPTVTDGENSPEEPSVTPPTSDSPSETPSKPDEPKPTPTDGDNTPEEPEDDDETTSKSDYEPSVTAPTSGSPSETPSKPDEPKPTGGDNSPEQPEDDDDEVVDGPECPDVVPRCLKTWLPLVGACKNGLDKDCYCKAADVIDKVYDCIYANGESDDTIAQAIQALQGICAEDIPKNPAIVTGGDHLTSYITVTGTPIITSAIYTTISIDTTVTVPCVEDGTTISGSSTTQVIKTEVPVPEITMPTPPKETGSENSPEKPVETGSENSPEQPEEETPEGEEPYAPSPPVVTAPPAEGEATPTPSADVPPTAGAGRNGFAFGLAVAAVVFAL